MLRCHGDAIQTAVIPPGGVQWGETCLELHFKVVPVVRFSKSWKVASRDTKLVK